MQLVAGDLTQISEMIKTMIKEELRVELDFDKDYYPNEEYINIRLKLFLGKDQISYTSVGFCVGS